MSNTLRRIGFVPSVAMLFGGLVAVTPAEADSPAQDYIVEGLSLQVSDDGKCATPLDNKNLENRSDCTNSVSRGWSVHYVDRDYVTLAYKGNPLQEGKVTDNQETSDFGDDAAVYKIDASGVLRVGYGEHTNAVLTYGDQGGNLANRQQGGHPAKLLKSNGEVWGKGDLDDAMKNRQQNSDKPAIVMVHGMNDTADAFDSMKAEFKKAGWAESDLFAWDYSGWRDSNEVNANRLVSAVKERFGGRKVAIVAHSLGSIPTRWALTHNSGFRDQVVSWISLGGPNTGAGQTFIKQVGLEAACSLGIVKNTVKAIKPDLVTDSTCELVSPYFMSDLNGNPTPEPTMYQEVVSSDDGQIENGASYLPQAPNNSSWKTSGVKHGDLPRNSGVIDHVITWIKSGPTRNEDVPYAPTVTDGVVRNQGEGVNLSRVSGTADDRMKTVHVTVDKVWEGDVTVSGGKWSVGFNPSLRSLSGTFHVTVTAQYGGLKYSGDRYIS